MTITQFVDKWAPQESSRLVAFKSDLNSLLSNHVGECLDEIMTAIEGTERPS